MEDRKTQVKKEIAALLKVIAKMIETSTDKYKEYEDFEIALSPYQRDLRKLNAELDKLEEKEKNGIQIRNNTE